ncbi:MAG: hypothetical protein DMF26_01070 [Verrucomicrobia bacterium]|nr:MAG: hypothetical protein DMF26_01070 [Verrucomicrobiota bacterium]
MREIKFLEKNAFDVIPKFLRDKSAAFFVDPPWRAGNLRGSACTFTAQSITSHYLICSKVQLAR